MNKWVLLAVFAFAGHGEFVAFAAMSEPGRQLVASDFANGTNGWTITNYNDVLSVSVTNGPDGAALVLANEKPGPGLLNTCFFVCSDWFPVEAGAELAAVVEARGEVSMLGPYVSGGVATGIKWFDAAKRPLCAQDVLGRMVPVAFEFGFRSLGFGWNKTVRTCVVPKGAAFAQIQLGGTEPDIPCGKRIEIRRIAVRARVPNASWDFGDLEPPKFELVSMTPNPDRMAEIRFRISDASKLDRESFVCKIDGVDVFSNLTYVGKGVCAYRPLRPWDEDSLHLIELDASDVHGNRGRETLAHFCGKRIEKGLVTLRDDGMTLVDGKPFFPIAPFAYKAAPCNGNDLERGLRDLKAIGVNAVHTYSTYQFGEKQAYGHHREYLGIVDACEKVGMKLIVEPGDRDYANPDRAMRLREIMLKARDHSCFLAWCIGDDTANYRRGDEVKTDDNIIKAMDNARLTTQADITTYAGRYRPYVHSTDTLMTEIYPFKAEIPEPAGLANVVRCMKFAVDDKRAVGDPVRGIWPLVQAFKGWKTWKRFPTREEIRAQTYLGIIHGGRGVTYYTYYSPSEGAEGVAQHMDSFGSVTKELSAIHDDLASRDAKAQPTVEILDGPGLDLNGNPSVTCLLKEGAEGKVPLLLAANAVTDKVVKAKIAGLRGCKVGTLFENGRKVDLQDGALVDVFGPGEVHVYRVFANGCARGAIERVELRSGWKFMRGDDPVIGTNYGFRLMSDVLDRADRGDFSGVPLTGWSAPDFDDGAWTDVRVPHDWGVESMYDPSRRYGDAFLDVTGIGWYRKEFDGKDAVLPLNGKVHLEFDGAMSYAHVWINGHFVGGWPYGYTRWRVDLTPYLNKSGRNVLAVRCHNVIDSSRWYTGGGLYRNCRLLVCPEDHVIPGSVRITTPEVTAKRAKVRVRYEMTRSGKKDYSFAVDNPRLWDVDDPYLYELNVEGNVYKYGIRTIAFHADERRFQLNGRTVPLNGVSMHHDFGVLGAAWNRAAQKRRLALFKEAGANAIRSSHNPPDEGLLELCDEMGILVFDEVFDEWRHTGKSGKRANGYCNIFDTWHERDLRAWIRTDRNHPCVILYSLGNEICDAWEDVAPHAEFVETARRLARIAAEEDPTRPFTNANNNPANYTNDVPRVYEVMGCNYFSWQYPVLRAAHPDVPFFGTETVCMSSTRGKYSFPVRQVFPRTGETPDFSNSSYCWEAVDWTDVNGGWACPPDVQWHWMDRAKTCMGEFVWTGIDYLGGPYWCDEWRKNPHLTDPVRQATALEDVRTNGLTRAAIHTCNTGFLDQAGFKKDAFWLFQSRWRPDLPMAHILPHWNWTGREGELTPVYVFTSGDEGELFLNGKSLGRQRKQPGVWDRAYRLRWDDVRYVPGKLEVVVYREGKEWARDAVVTAGRSTHLKMETETGALVSDGEDVCFVNVSVCDADGNVIPDACDKVSFSVEGPGEIVATDNGYEADMGDWRRSEHDAFCGLVQAIVRAKPGARGALKIVAQSPGLRAVSTTVHIHPANGKTKE